MDNTKATAGAHSRRQQLEALGRVLDTLDELRVKCPWDRKQTNLSLRPNTVEEVHELGQALLDDAPADIRKELGDLLLHIFFYAKIGAEQGRFDIADVADSLNAKLIFRHPHVFGQERADDAEAVTTLWEKVKLKEKGGNRTLLEGVPRALPALIKAQRIQEKVANVGFDWERREDVWAKVKEEVAEVQAEIDAASPDALEAEMGDLMFALVNAMRLYGVNPENALERTNRKFIARFNHIEQAAAERGLSLSDMTLAQMEALWQEAKGL